MSTGTQISCPHCQAPVSLSEEQLQSADGQVRCDECLRFFDGHSGEAVFIPPSITTQEPANPFAGLFVQPMESAELPFPPQAAPTGLKIVLLGLVMLLMGQLAWYELALRARPEEVLSIAQLVVRADPEQEQALQLDAILHNNSDRPQPYPALFLYLDNRYGERRAQRLFPPAEYLPSRLVESGRLPAHSRVQISLALQDPGRGAVNYGLALESLPTAQN